MTSAHFRVTRLPDVLDVHRVADLLIALHVAVPLVQFFFFFFFKQKTAYEIGGIKLHAAIDVVIRHNRIHDCSLGTWLDWQTQGTRISRNVYYANNRDLFVEVSHGPYLVDHNVFASTASVESFSQGGAFVNNLLCGTLRWEPVMDRATPYHVPHSTQVAGYAVIYGADDRYMGNVFIGGDVDRAYAPGSR